MTDVRRASAADVPAIRRLVDAAFGMYVERIGGKPMPMRVEYAEVVREADVRVAVDEGRIVGVLVVRREPDHLLVETVAVDPSRQGTGLGSELLTLAERTAREDGYAEVRLYTNELMTENLAYYPRRGYQEAEHYVGDGFRRVLFRKAMPDRGRPAEE